VDARDLFRDAVEAEVDGLPIRVISLEHLIRNERAAGPVDLLDADFLERVRDRRA
jgi:fructose 1,6-bisphosphatase